MPTETDKQMIQEIQKNSSVILIFARLSMFVLRQTKVVFSFYIQLNEIRVQVDQTDTLFFTEDFNTQRRCSFLSV